VHKGIVLTRIKAWVNEHAYNGEYMDILIVMTWKWNCTVDCSCVRKFRKL